MSFEIYFFVQTLVGLGTFCIVQFGHQLFGDPESDNPECQ
jgi:hypothetical protein